MGEQLYAARARRRRRCTSATASATSPRRPTSTPRCCARDLLDYLPQHAGERPARWPAVAPPGERARRRRARPSRARVYDVRTCRARPGRRRPAARGRRRAGRATSSARSRGSTAASVGVVANQPRHLGGVLDADAAQKAARFVRTCDLFGLPLVVLVDTPGFLPGSRAGAGGRDPPRRQARARVRAGDACPKVTVVLRKAFGGAFIAMNSKDLGADLTFAWPQRAARRDGRQAGGRHRPPPRDRRGADPDAPRDRLARDYAERAPDRAGRRRASGFDRRGRRRRSAHAGDARCAAGAATPLGSTAEERPDALAPRSTTCTRATRFATRGRTVTEADVVAFAAQTGDFHPQHVDAAWAAAAPFGERIAHGMLVLVLRGRARPVRPRARARAAPRRRRRVQAPGAARRHDPRARVGRGLAAVGDEAGLVTLALARPQPGRRAVVPREVEVALAARRRPARPTRSSRAANGFVPIPL